MKTKRLQFISAFLLLFFVFPSGIFSRTEARTYPQYSGETLVSIVVNEARQSALIASSGTQSSQSRWANPCFPVVGGPSQILQAPSLLNLNQSASCFTLSVGQIAELPVLTVAVQKPLPTVVVLRLAAMNFVSWMNAFPLPEQKNSVPLAAAVMLAACAVAVRKIRKTVFMPRPYATVRFLSLRMEVLRC